MTLAINTILIVGAGCIGTQVAAACALRGLATHVYDTDKGQLDRAQDMISGKYSKLAEQGLIGRDTAQKALERLKCFPNLDKAAADADMVSESVPEDPELKRTVFARLNKVCKPETIFTTNTSDLVPSMIAPVLDRPQQLAAFHFHAPLSGGDVVDIMPHPGTAPEVLASLRELAGRLGQTVIELKTERPGYVFNNMLNALNRAALELAVDGVATPETIDKAWTKIMHTGLGPFGILDKVGLDTAHRITKIGAEHYQDPVLWRIADYLGEYVAQGKLGVKTGQGFYTYGNAD